MAKAVSGIDLRDLSGDALHEALDDLAALRIAVFRDYPYLYVGDADYERAYLDAYVKSDRAIVVGAYADGRLVGAATAAPMADHALELAAPFEAHGIDVGDVFYFGESVLLPDWRGRGIGHGFMERREAKGREEGFAFAAFCAVVRSADHPARPGGYSPLDPLWQRHGFAPVAGLVAQFAWTEVGGVAEEDHAMQFWMKPLTG